MSATHFKSGKPHGWIHNELRRRCGGPPVAAATRDQLKERIVAVRTLHREL
ncbi:DNA/RNA helicase, superfamily II [Mycobacteroides abscessus subsp. massiliense]|nr:DNA/RNA helicase, superfamily II [Mycobacteroides abscessus subsp. massiliense]